MSNIRDGIMVATAAGGVLGIMATVEFGAPAAIFGVAMSFVSGYCAVTSGKSQPRSLEALHDAPARTHEKPAPTGNARQQRKAKRRQNDKENVRIEANDQEHEAVAEEAAVA